MAYLIHIFKLVLVSFFSIFLGNLLLAFYNFYIIKQRLEFFSNDFFSYFVFAIYGSVLICIIYLFTLLLLEYYLLFKINYIKLSILSILFLITYLFIDYYKIIGNNILLLLLISLFFNILFWYLPQLIRQKN